jgi:hypothetical protein
LSSNGGTVGSGDLITPVVEFDLTYVNAVWVGDRQAVLDQPLDVQGNCLADELLGFLVR